MFDALRSGLGRLNLTLLGLALLVATFWLTDQVTNDQPKAPKIDRAAVIAQRQAQPSDARVFVYIIDSLRYETALDPAIMPNLVALRAEGASARMMPGFNSGTAASLRDAFTGRENAAVLATVATFVHSDAGVESLFHQMALQGRTSAAYSAGFFKQFGAGITFELSIPNASSRDEQDTHVLASLEALRGGEFDCVIGHLFYTDDTAHEEGVGTPVYEEAFRRADALIPLIRARLPEDAHLVITGDHGHDLKGRHGIGLDVPALAVYVGPRFRRGVDLGSTPVMSHRYLISQALGLPVTTEGYVGDHLPAALVGPPVLPAQEAAQTPTVRIEGSGFVWVYLSFCAALWFNLVCRGSSPMNFDRGRALLLWAAIVPFFFDGWTQIGASTAVMGGLLVLMAWRVSWHALALWLALPVALAFGFQGWGRVLTAIRPWLQELPHGALAIYWIVVVAAGAALATRARRRWVMAVVFAVPAFLFYPVYHHYGFPGTLFPLMASWFVFYGVSLARDGCVREPATRVKLAVAAVLLFLMLQPFAISVTSSGTFDRWHALVPGWNTTNVGYMLVVAILAKALIFFPQKPRWPALALGAVFIALVQVIESRWWVPDFYQRRNLALLMLAGWVVARWRRRPEARLCGLTFFFLLYFSFVALTPRNFSEIAVMIGALAVCAQVVVWFPQRENLRADYLTLALFGLMITGWAAMRWSGTHLEWHAIYEFAAAATVEENVAWFVPWIALKGLIPWLIILWMLSRLDDLYPRPSREMLMLFSAKIMTLLMLTVGLGDIDTHNRGYLETASVVGAFVMFYLGVILLPRAWPRLSNPSTRDRSY